MMKFSTSLACLLFCISNAFSQKLEWVKGLDGFYDYDRGNDVATDATGNVYTVGGFFGTVDFDPGSGNNKLTSRGSYDIFISKLNSSGNFVWAKSIGLYEWDEATSICVDASGNIFIAGFYNDTVDFDPGPAKFNLPYGDGNIFLCKIDPSGNFVWAKAMGDKRYSRNVDIDVDLSGNVYLVGYFAGEIDFDPGIGVFNLRSKGSDDVFISKFDPSGNFVWAKSVGGSRIETASNIDVDVFGNIYIVGDFDGTADFDPGIGKFELTAYEQHSQFALKIDVNGNFI